MSSHVHLVDFLFSWHPVAVTHTFNEYMPDRCQPLRYFSLLQLIFLWAMMYLREHEVWGCALGNFLWWPSQVFLLPLGSLEELLGE